MNIPAAEREFRPLQKLPDDVLRLQRYKSVFHHTRFKDPRLDLVGTYCPAVQLDSGSL